MVKTGVQSRQLNNWCEPAVEMGVRVTKDFLVPLSKRLGRLHGATSCMSHHDNIVDDDSGVGSGGVEETEFENGVEAIIFKGENTTIQLS